MATRQQAASRSAVEWRSLVREWERSGKTREAFAESRGLVVGTLGWWIGKIRRLDRLSARPSDASTSSAFLPVKVVSRLEPVSVATVEEHHVEIVLASGEHVRVPVGVDAAWVGQLVVAVRGGARC